MLLLVFSIIYSFIVSAVVFIVWEQIFPPLKRKKAERVERQQERVQSQPKISLALQVSLLFIPVDLFVLVFAKGLLEKKLEAHGVISLCLLIFATIWAHKYTLNVYERSRHGDRT